MNNYDTITEAITDLRKRGYVHDFNLAAGQDCLVCHQDNIELSPEDFEIEELYRFEGDSDPGDEMILYAISSSRYNINGLLLNAYGTYEDGKASATIQKLTIAFNNQ